MPIKIKLPSFRDHPKLTLIIGIALIVAGITTFLLLPTSSPPPTKGAADEQPELNPPPSRIRALGMAIKTRLQRLGNSIRNSFSYLSNFIVKVLLPRLSPEQRERLYNIIQTITRIKEFLSSNFYLILAMAVGGLVAYIGLKRYQRKR